MNPKDLLVGAYYQDNEGDICEYLGSSEDQYGDQEYSFRWVVLNNRRLNVTTPSYNFSSHFIKRIKLDINIKAEREIDKLLGDQ
jgi:hypothetical protein